MTINEETASHNQAHYNGVTDAWMHILGDNLHYGFFVDTRVSLPEATDQLIWEMAAFGGVDNGLRILDVGCGIGTPAIALQEKYGCHITGITISERGVELARAEVERRGLTHELQFLRADALDNGLTAESFDMVWQMESSHLMHDKITLFKENFRVLNAGGSLVLCDLFLKKEFSVVDIYNYRNELAILESAFGKAKMATIPYYRQCLGEVGFSGIETVDISHNVKPTLRCWKENVMLNQENVGTFMNSTAVDDFLEACNILELFFDQDLLGYGLIKARKSI